MKLPHALLDALVEPVLVFDDSARLVHANQAALRCLPCEPGMNLADLAPALGQSLLDRCARCWLAGASRSGFRLVLSLARFPACPGWTVVPGCCACPSRRMAPRPPCHAPP